MRDLIFRSLVLLVATSTIAALLVNPGNYSKAMNLNIEENPLLAKWEGPYGGVPPFDRVQISLFKPALEAVWLNNSRRLIALPKIQHLLTSKTRSLHSEQWSHDGPRYHSLWSLGCDNERT